MNGLLSRITDLRCGWNHGHVQTLQTQITATIKRGRCRVHNSQGILQFTMTGVDKKHANIHSRRMKANYWPQTADVHLLSPIHLSA